MLYFVRHGATDWNENKNAQGEKDSKCQGTADIELNNNGIKQAEETAKALKDVKFTKIYCSPLKRAVETCKIINKDNLPVTIDSRIIERNFGEFEGLPCSQFDFEGFWNYKNEVLAEGAETLKELTERVYSFLVDLEELPSSENILVVSHGGVGLVLAGYFKGKPVDGNYLVYSIPNGKPVVYDFQKPCY